MTTPAETKIARTITTNSQDVIFMWIFMSRVPLATTRSVSLSVRLTTGQMNVGLPDRIVPGVLLKEDEPGPALRSRARLSRRTPNWFAQSSRLGEHVVSSETKRGDSLRESSFAV